MASGNGGVGVGGNCGESESSDSLRTFGAVLKALRDEARLTQEQFAPLVQYSAAYIAKIEQGKRFPPGICSTARRRCWGRRLAACSRRRHEA